MQDDSGREVTALLIHPTTGEHLGEMYEGDEIIRGKKDRSPAPPSQGTNIIFIGGNFIKIPDTALSVLCEKHLTKTEKSVLLTLLGFLQFCNQECRHKNKKPITAEWLANHTDSKTTAISRALKSLEKSGFILRQGNKIIVNPYFAMRGKITNKSIAYLFRDTELAKARTSI